jgi:WD40 repeat protein
LSEDFPALTGFRVGSLLAGYRLEAQVGAGGMAVVFRARDQRLGRLVALKILAPALAADPGFRRRFIAESRAAAAVDDPHIIPVHEAGEAGGVLFIAMRFVAGGDLRRVLEQEGPLAPGRAAGFISPVASALDAAHRAGLVHRDVKPANILVDVSAGRPDHVYLSDFGVSKGAMSSVSLTGTGQFLGTPEYSAPEQVQGRAVDGRADQYALACVTYQLLTGSAPFQRDQGMAVLLAHLSEPPPSLCSRRPGLPGAADQVLARALAKAPEKRYRSCGDFADALREALGLPPYISLGSASAPGHPHPGFPGRAIAAQTGTAAVPADPAAAETIDSVPRGGQASAVGVPAAAAIVTGPGYRLNEGIHVLRGGPGTGGGAGAAPPAAPASAEGGVPAAGGAPSHPTGRADESGRRTRQPGKGRGNHGAQPTQRPRRRVLAIALACAVLAAAAVVPFVIARSPGSPRHGSQAPATTTTPRTATTSPSTPGSPRPGSLAATLTDPRSHGVIVNWVAFSPDGTMLAAGDEDGSTDLWDVATKTLAATLTDPGSYAGAGVSSVAFSPHGTTLAVGDEDGSTYLWDVSTKAVAATRSFPGDNGFGFPVTFSPDGTTLAVGGGNGSTYLWEVATKTLAATLTDPGTSNSDVGSVAFSPDGTMLATISNSSIYLWDVATKSLAATLTDPRGQGVNSVAFSPDGTMLAAGDGNDLSGGSTDLWDVATKSLAATLTDPRGQGVNSVAFSPDGTMLAAGDGNGSTYLWDVATKSLAATLSGPDSQDRGPLVTPGVVSVAFSPNGTTLAAGDDNGRIYLWNTGRHLSACGATPDPPAPFKRPAHRPRRRRPLLHAASLSRNRSINNMIAGEHAGRSWRRYAQ